MLEDDYPRALPMAWNEVLRQEREFAEGLKLMKTNSKSNLLEKEDLNALVMGLNYLSTKVSNAISVVVEALSKSGSVDLGNDSSFASRGFKLTFLLRR